MSGENTMTQATDELLLTTAIPPRNKGATWHGVPIAWAIVARSKAYKVIRQMGRDTPIFAMISARTRFVRRSSSAAL